jgi:hypothetical protein
MCFGEAVTCGNPADMRAVEGVSAAPAEGELMPQPPAPTPACLVGRHRAKRVRLLHDGRPLATTCRDCGCTLVRTGATRSWYYSGKLGAA